MESSIKYLAGFKNIHQSEAISGSLPINQNSPQKCPNNLFAEQLSGSAFTTPRNNNLKSWLYKLAPSVMHEEFKPYKHPTINHSNFEYNKTPPTQFRWFAEDFPKRKINFIDGLTLWAFNGCSLGNTGASIYLYAINLSMENEFFYNADGELLIVPETGNLIFQTEFGELRVGPTEIVVIPRGIKFKVELQNENARGYVLENHGASFELPELGPIGANGLANPRHFLYPKAKHFEEQGEYKIITKFQNNMWQTKTKVHPLNVVAWYGNYAPYKYDLKLFNTINTVSFDHPDPSIFTVLTSPTTRQGVANIDFVIFPPRWMVAKDTFRPPYFHRNIMSEFMGLIQGKYDAKNEAFMPGGCSLHNSMSAHGPDAESYNQGLTAELQPEYINDTMAFMFESSLSWCLSKEALSSKKMDKDYLRYWSFPHR